MNRLTQELARICGQRLLDPKWLIAPSLRVGQQWLTAVARQDQSLINVQVKTLRGLALELAGPELAEADLRLAPPRAAMLLLEGVVAELADRLVYFSAFRSRAGLAKMLYQSLDDLRLAGIEPADLDPKSFETLGKGQDLYSLFQAYLARLAGLGLCDYAGVLKLAIERLHQEASLLAEAAVLLPADLDLSCLERRLTSAIARPRLILLEVDEPARLGQEARPSTDLELVRWLDQQAEAPEPLHDGSVLIERGLGEAAEVRGLLRRCLAEGIPLDQVEVLYTDAETYIPLIYETLAKLYPVEEASEEGLPVTFAQGLPSRYSRPARALAAWLGWIRGGYPQSVLVRMIADGLLLLPEGGQETSFSSLASCLRSLGISLGRQRYLVQIDLALAAGRDSGPGRREDEEAEGPAQPRERLRELKILRRLVADLLALTPEPDDPPLTVLAQAASFLSSACRSESLLDNFARVKFVEEIADLAGWIKSTGAGQDESVWNWLASLPAQTRLAGSGPRPGCLHAAHLFSGGFSGRPQTFILGLDDVRFPGAGLQDSVLLDSERRRLSPELRTASEEQRLKLLRLGRLLAGLRGRVILSFSCRDLAEDAESFASPVVLSAFRLISGQREGDQSDLNRWLKPPRAFVPESEAECLDEAEWWLWRILGDEPMGAALELVCQRFPHLGQGLDAARRRESAEFTAHDGLVPEAGQDLDPFRPDGPVMSASKLQRLGACPLGYFFRHVLELKPPPDLAIEPGLWLDALEKGGLLHELFYSFMIELAGRPPRADRDRERLLQILEDLLGAWREKAPPASQEAFRRQREELRRIALIFLKEEERFGQSSQPVYLEAAISSPASPAATPLDSKAPATLAVADGRKIRAGGRLDRVDRLKEEPGEVYAVWDYKTGSSSRYGRADPFRQGRLAQHYLYLALAQVRLRSVSPQARAERFGFFFPGLKPRGERISWTRDELAAGPQILGRLCQIAAKGAFLATDKSDDCYFCDFIQICGDAEARAKTSRFKLENRANLDLEEMRRLRLEEDAED